MGRLKITKGKINFLVRKDAGSKDGLCPIQLRYSLGGKPSPLMIGRSILEYNWDDYAKEAVFVPKPLAKKMAPDISYNLFMQNMGVMDLNAYLGELERHIKDIETKFTLDEHDFTSQEVISELRKIVKPDEAVKEEKRKKKKEITLVDFIELNKNEKVGVVAEGTLKAYVTVMNGIREFEASKKRTYYTHEVNYEYFDQFAKFMMNRKKELVNATIKKRLAHTRVFLDRARKQGYKVDDSYKDFEWVENDIEVVALTMEELEKIKAADIYIEKYQQVRDVFLFMCYTGLRFSDTKDLKKHNIKNGYIRLTAKKTKELNGVPLSTRAKELIEKYKTEKNDHIFPTPVNQKFNVWIKEVAKIAGLTETVEKVRFIGAKRRVELLPRHNMISAHTARKTFVTLSLELGMKAEEVMPVTGHRSYKSFQRYVKVTEKRAKEALLSAWEK
ncbi:tyrosine-type recombinase/integrase [Sphingobacterium sp.]|uniref:site-specific integrase n=1 Tax=Sphingobacterium sp. TaxID=341027 RepID=UPI0028B08CBC|nr:tyrosine-type recombinase/integrase [Sphingobacterium sp.]